MPAPWSIWGGLMCFFSQNMGDGPVHECFRLGMSSRRHAQWHLCAERRKDIGQNTEISAIYYKLYIYYYISLWLCKLANIFFYQLYQRFITLFFGR